MTDEHKTLDDFPFSEIIKNDLKREAIKWVKACILAKIKNPSCKKDMRCYACERTMKMNNITEEDLK